jgi:hypothetical protein
MKTQIVNGLKECKMGYEKNDAKVTGKLGEKEVKQKLVELGLAVRRPGGGDIGIDFLAHFPGSPDLAAKLQVKGRRQKDTPRWFQATVTAKMLKEAYEKGVNLEQTWRNRINFVDFWLLVSIPLNEIWVLPASITMELAELNWPYYKTREDNQFDQLHYDKYGKIKKKQKELNLNKTDKNGQKFTDRFKYYLNNFDLIIEFLRKLEIEP